MLLIDLIYINSPGGISLSRLLLDHIIKNNLEDNVELLIDNRNFKLFNDFRFKKTIISKTEYSRLFFYLKNKNRFKSIFCFANVPPPIKIETNVLIYFHNEILLNNKNLNFSLFKIYFFNLKWIYIKSRNSGGYTWIVQTDHIKSLLGKKLVVNSNSILKYPLFQNLKMNKCDKIENSFIYPTSDLPHKNNEVLLNAFKDAAYKTNKKIILTITIDKIEIADLPQNLHINFIGLIEHEELMDNMKKTKFLIFPSLRESFGLPLVEGIQANCKIITSNLNFVNELISPSYTFDPFDEKSITEAILLTLTKKRIPKSFIKINNSIDLIFKKLIDV